jgi:hypothetical protein
MAISTNGAIITRLAGALYNEYLSNASYTELSTTAPATVAANFLSNDFAGKTDAQIATTVLTNLSLNTVAGLDNWVAAQLTAAGSTAAAKGAKLVSMLNDYANMTADATYGASATSFNTKVAASLVLSQTDGSAGGAFATAGTAPASGGTFILTTGNDVADASSALRGSLVSDFRFTSGDEIVQGTVGTLTTGDVLVDNSTTDNDSLNATIKVATGQFTAQNIETINVTYMAGTTPTLEMDNVLGTKNINVVGTAAGIIDGFAADSVQPTITMNGFTRQLTISPVTLDGSTTAGTAETINLAVSGVTYGSSAATRSIALIDGTSNGSLEVLNVQSNGDVANAFKLDVAASDSVAKINISGSAALTMRADAAEITGVTVASTATGTATLAIDMNGTTGDTPVNAANYSGVALAAYDSTAGSDSAGMSSVLAGSSITFMSDFDQSVFTVQGATYAAQASALSFTLDHSTANTDLDVANITVENVKALTFTSNGHAASDSATAQNNIGTLDGDATTITILGDTSFQASLDIDAVESATTATTARTVTVDASGMTGNAFVVLSAVADSKVTYNITGTGMDDTLSTNATGGSLTGGAGNDTLTGGTAANVISGGDGNDTIVLSAGADSISGGSGNDTFDLNDIDVTGVKKVDTVTIVVGATGDVLSGDTISVTINDVVKTMTITNLGTNTATGDVITAVRNQLVSFINNEFTDVVDAATSDTAALTITAETAGTTFTVDVLDAFTETATTATATDGTTTANVVAVSMDTTITDFALGDILDLAGIVDETTVDFFKGAAASLSAGSDASENILVITDVSYADVAAVEDAYTDEMFANGDDIVVIFLNSTLGYAQLFFDTDADTDDTSTNTLINFTGITTLTQLSAAFTVDSFLL